MSGQQLTWTADGPVTLAGAVSVQVTGERVQPWRIRHDWQDLYEPTLLPRAAEAAGVRLTLVSDTSRLAVAVEPVEAAAQPGRHAAWAFDLLVDGRFFARQMATLQTRRVRFDHLPAGTHRLELYLPQTGAVRLGPVTIDADATAQRWHDPRRKWVVYGSSITQCAAAAGPSETWPALVANRFDLNLTCLGFSGQCHLDPIVGRTLSQLPADLISLCLGINTHGGSFNERTFRAAVIGFIQLIRDRHPHTPLVCVSPIHAPDREDGPGTTGMTLKLMRRWIASAIDALQAHGDDNLAYADGFALFGPADLSLMPDGLHPDAQGYRRLADHYADQVMPRLGLARPAAERP